MIRKGNNMNWNGILKIDYMNHISKDGDLIWEDYNLKNLLHRDGEEFIVKSMFLGGTNNAFIPSSYYFGLDNRPTISVTNKLNDLMAEPSGNGYFRKTVNSSNEFLYSVDESGISQASSPILTFSATGGSYSAVNLFLSTSLDNSGFLISSVVLNNPLVISNGESFNLRMSLKLRDCP
jgi:hypothetical protein